MLLLYACSPPPPAPVAKPAPDITVEPWYGQSVDQLAGMNRQAAQLFETGKADLAAAIVTAGQPLETRLLAATHPTLRAVEAASDLDQLYGKMLLANRHYGWARLAFQKNLTRWKNWKPQTPESVRRFREAQAAIAECDRQISR